MSKKGLFGVVALVMVLGLYLYPSEKDRLNRQMEELCKIDGGMKVYETVTLPPEMFDKHGIVKQESVRVAGLIADPDSWLKFDEKIRRAIISSNESEIYIVNGGYIVIQHAEIIKNGDPSKNGRLSKELTTIYFKNDGKVISERVQYFRGGGDLWSAGQHSSSVCPRKTLDILMDTFKKDSGK